MHESLNSVHECNLNEQGISCTQRWHTLSSKQVFLWHIVGMPLPSLRAGFHPYCTHSRDWALYDGTNRSYCACHPLVDPYICITLLIPHDIWEPITCSKPDFGLAWPSGDDFHGELQWDRYTGADGYRTVTRKQGNIVNISIYTYIYILSINFSMIWLIVYV